MPNIFISYRREDSAGIAGRLYDRLSTHFGKDSVFIDIDAIPAGVDFREHLRNAVTRGDAFIAVIGERWLSRDSDGLRRIDDPSDHLRIEIATALTQNVLVIPALVGPVSMPRAADLPEDLLPLVFRNAIQIDQGKDFNNHVQRLINELQDAVPTEQAGARTTLSELSQQFLLAHTAMDITRVLYLVEQYLSQHPNSVDGRMLLDKIRTATIREQDWLARDRMHRYRPMASAPHLPSASKGNAGCGCLAVFGVGAILYAIYRVGAMLF